MADPTPAEDLRGIYRVHVRTADGTTSGISVDATSFRNACGQLARVGVGRHQIVGAVPPWELERPPGSERGEAHLRPSFKFSWTVASHLLGAAHLVLAQSDTLLHHIYRHQGEGLPQAIDEWARKIDEEGLDQLRAVVKIFDRYPGGEIDVSDARPLREHGRLERAIRELLDAIRIPMTESEAEKVAEVRDLIEVALDRADDLKTREEVSR